MIPKNQTVTTLKKKADKIFSEYIRRSWADDNGYVSCVTCGVTRQWNDKMDAGHYISRTWSATRFDKKNVHPQCKGCNSFGKGRLDEYAIFLRERYGEDVLDELHEKKHSLKKMGKEELFGVIYLYNQKVKEL